MLHGCFSLGTVVGALLGMGLTAAAFPVGWHLTVIAVLIAAAAVKAVLAIPHGTGMEEAAEATGPGGLRGQLVVWRDRRLVLIGVIVLAMAFAEGAANDWLPLLMVDGYEVSATAGSLTFLVFASSMTLGRFAGGPLLERFGRARTVRISAVVAALGLAVVIVAPSPAMAGAATVLWGLGASLGFRSPSPWRATTRTTRRHGSAPSPPRAISPSSSARPDSASSPTTSDSGSP